jgi:hypothetical protein
MQILEEIPTKSPTLYRCGAPDPTVNAGVPIEQLRLLTASDNGQVVFFGPIEGLSDEQVCSPSLPDALDKPDWRQRFLSFEVFGPVHYYVMGGIGDEKWRSKLELARIRRITPTGPHALKLEIMDRTGNDGTWAGGPKETPYTLTIQFDGNRIYVPEMSRHFVRCRRSPEEVYRMHNG